MSFQDRTQHQIGQIDKEVRRNHTFVRSSRFYARALLQQLGSWDALPVGKADRQ